MNDPIKKGEKVLNGSPEWFGGDPKIAKETAAKIDELYPKLTANPALYNQPKLKAFLDRTVHLNSFVPDPFAGLSMDLLFTPHRDRPGNASNGEFIDAVKQIDPTVVIENRTLDMDEYRSFLMENEALFRPQAQSAIHTPSDFFLKTLSYFTTFSEFVDSGYRTIMNLGRSDGAYSRLLQKNLDDDRVVFILDTAQKKGVRQKDGFFEVGESLVDIPLADNSVDFLAIHCAFETFEGNTDIQFMAEATRILSPGGRVMILPLLQSESLLYRVNPIVGSFEEGFFERLEKDARKSKATVEFQTENSCGFARMYGPKSFQNRILGPAKDQLKGSLILLEPSADLPKLTFFEGGDRSGSIPMLPENAFFHYPILVLEKMAVRLERDTPIEVNSTEDSTGDTKTATKGRNQIQLLDESLIDDHTDLAMDVLAYSAKLGIGLGWHYILDLIWVFKELTQKPGSVILDAGGGNGLLQFMLAGKGYKVISADVRERKIPKFAKNMYNVPVIGSGDRLEHDYLRWHRISGRQKSEETPEMNPDLPTVVFYHSHLNQLDQIEDRSIDAVVSISVMEHNPPEDIAPIISEFERVRKEDAPMILTISGAAKSYFHEASFSWILNREDIEEAYGLKAPIETNYDSIESHWQAMAKPRYLRKWLGKYYFNNKKSGMPGGIWDPQYLPVGVIKI